jgi:hypothetical protein
LDLKDILDLVFAVETIMGDGNTSLEQDEAAFGFLASKGFCC